MKKKLVAVLLSSVMVMTLFAGCGSTEEKPAADADTSADDTADAASGEYEATLTAEMSKSSAPTLFQCGNQQGLNTWGDYCLDLSDTDVYAEMTTDDFNLKGEDGSVKASVTATKHLVLSQTRLC